MRKGYRFQVISYSLIFSFLFTVICTLSTVYAADSTPSADIKSKLEELKKEIASKAAKLKQEVNKKLQDKAYVGKVKTKTASSLTLAARTGPKIVTLNQDTTYESQVKTKQKFSVKNLAEEDYVASLGDIDDNGVLTAKKVVLLPNPKEITKIYLWGQVISVSDGLVTIKNRDLKNIAMSTANISTDLKLNDFVILTGQFNKNEIFEAGFVYVIPQGGIIKPKKVATPSAQLATSSAKPKSSTH